MNLIKWALFAGSMFALVKLGLARRAGSILRAMLGRFGLLILALVVITLPVVGPQNGSRRSVAHATNCSKVIPVESLVGSQIGAGGSAAFVTGIGLDTAVSPLVAGAAAPVAASATLGVAGTVGLAAGVFVGAFYGTCKFLEWATGDGEVAEDIPLQTSSTSTLGDWGRCADVLTLFPSGLPTNAACRSMTYASSLPSSAPFSQQAGGALVDSQPVTIPTPNYGNGALYGPTPSSGVPLRAWSINVAGSTSCPVYTVSQVVASANMSTCGHNSTPGRFFSPLDAVRNTTCTYPDMGTGGACGIHPNSVVVERGVATSGTTRAASGPFLAVYNLDPEMRDLGWKRRIVVDVNCYGSGWVRTMSAVYRDRAVTTRIEVPSCPAGERSIAFNVWRVPIGFDNLSDCPLGTELCFDADARMMKWVAPTNWTSSPPAWVTCLNSNVDCGTPVSGVGGTCTWGGISVGAEFCNADRQAGVVPGTMPVGTGAVIAPAYVPGVLPNTSTQAEDPGPTTTVAPGSSTTIATGAPVAIDPGEGARCYAEATTSTAATSTTAGGSTTTTAPAGVEIPCQGGYSDGGDDPCLPSGWGWFNPVEWVLKPVKCALIWAFVPDSETVQDAWDGLLTDVQTNAPIAWAYKAHALVVDASDGMEAAVEGNSAGCITVIPGGGDLTGTAAGEVCPSSMGFNTMEEARPWLGYAVWLAWAWTMYGALFRKAPASTEPEQLSLF